MLRPLFVYGTLLPGQPHGGLLKGLSQTRAQVLGSLFRLPQGYPALVLGGRLPVHGVLVDGVDTRRLTLLDQMEGVAEGLYQRVDCTAVVGLRQRDAQAYVMTDPERRGGIPIPSGRWTGVIRRGPGG